MTNRKLVFKKSVMSKIGRVFKKRPMPSYGLLKAAD